MKGAVRSFLVLVVVLMVARTACQMEAGPPVPPTPPTPPSQPALPPVRPIPIAPAPAPRPAPTPTPPPAPAPAPAPQPPPAGAAREVLSIQHEWTDPNTQRVVEYRGDTVVIDPRYPAKRLALTVQLDKQSVNDDIEAFGFPPEDLVFRWDSREGRAPAEARYRARLAERGFELNGDMLSVDYQWVIDRSGPKVRHVAAGLRQVARRHGYEPGRGHLGVLASFVQGLKYQIPTQRRQTPSGRTVETTGVLMPLEALAAGWGDCDTKCLLFASLLARRRSAELILLVGNDHMFVGVQAPPRQNDRFVKVRNLRYVLVELTTPWALGRISEQQWKAARRNSYRIVPVT